MIGLEIPGWQSRPRILGSAEYLLPQKTNTKCNEEAKVCLGQACEMGLEACPGDNVH